MPGTVTVVQVSVGDEVSAGTPLLVVEAMKMEHVLTAPVAGTVAELEVTAGQTVALDERVAVVTPSAAGQSSRRTDVGLPARRRDRGAAQDRGGVRPRGGRAAIGELYERDEFPYDIVRQMGEMGLFGLPFPEEYGGMGGDYFALCLALEELARVDSLGGHHAGGRRSRWARCRSTGSAPRSRSRSGCPGCAPGEALGAFGLTEPGGGSDAGAHPDHGPARGRRSG